MLTDDSEYESVGEVSVKGQLDQISPQPKELHRLGQANEDVTECQGLYLITRAQRLPVHTQSNPNSSLCSKKKEEKKDVKQKI